VRERARQPVLLKAQSAARGPDKRLRFLAGTQIATLKKEARP